jgi:hypothetical protein
VAADVDSLVSARARLAYSNVRGSLGRVDDEKGRKWQLALDGDAANGKEFVRAWGSLDLGFALPLRHSSVWLRSSAGASPNDRREPFANFYFGGFGNNWVDQGEEKRYRTRDSFPGVAINDVGGRNYLKSTIEWNLPPLRFRRAGRPGFYATWARPALFAGGLVTNLDVPGARRTLANVGAQMDVRFSILSSLDLTLSGGYALAFEEGRGVRRQAMVSLKLLR